MLVRLVQGDVLVPFELVGHAERAGDLAAGSQVVVELPELVGFGVVAAERVRALEEVIGHGDHPAEGGALFVGDLLAGHGGSPRSWAVCPVAVSALRRSVGLPSARLGSEKGTAMGDVTDAKLAAQKALFEEIADLVEAAKRMNVQSRVTLSLQLSLAYRYAAGGAQPGGGLDNAK